jgi:hypothetical protein
MKKINENDFNSHNPSRDDEKIGINFNVIFPSELKIKKEKKVSFLMEKSGLSRLMYFNNERKF